MTWCRLLAQHAVDFIGTGGFPLPWSSLTCHGMAVTAFVEFCHISVCVCVCRDKAGIYSVLRLFLFRARHTHACTRTEGGREGGRERGRERETEELHHLNTHTLVHTQAHTRVCT